MEGNDIRAGVIYDAGGGAETRFQLTVSIICYLFVDLLSSEE